jgi:hypothetical protein
MKVSRNSAGMVHMEVDADTAVNLADLLELADWELNPGLAQLWEALDDVGICSGGALDLDFDCLAEHYGLEAKED